MEKSKLIEILRTFDKGEINSFTDFVRSPFFNKEKVLIKIAEYLQKRHPDYNSDIEKEKVFGFLYPGKKYNDGLMRNIISDVMRLAEEFLAVKHMRKNGHKKELLLLEELNEKKLESHFLKHKLKLEKVIESSPFKDEFYYSQKAEFAILYNNFLKKTSDTYIRENHIVQEVSDLLTINFLIRVIYYNAHMINRQSYIENFSFRLNMADEIDAFFEKEGKKYLSIPYIECNYLSFKLFQTKDKKYFYMLKDFLNKNFALINESDRKSAYTVLENYCYARVIEGKAEFVKQQFELYKQAVEKGTIKGVTNYISNVLFMSIVATGLEAGEFSWIEKFIKDNINDVKEEMRKDTYNFSLALVNYWKKDFESALTELAKVNNDEFAFKHNIKSLYLKIYFDMNETEPFYSHIDTYKHFILNNKYVHDKVREQVNSFINYSKKLFDIKNSLQKDKQYELDLYGKEITANNALVNKIWLLKKIEEIK
jgi:hypothetical protein